jgi:hypothetical protein
MPVTTGMKGDGFYDRNSSPQMAAMAAVLPWIEQAIGKMDLPDVATPVVVVDFACSEGRNSIAGAQRIAAALRQRTTRAIQTVHSDLPTNNFNQVFLNLAEAARQGWPSNVYSAATGGSMFEHLMPPGTVTIATTYNAIGFLDRRPALGIADYILPMGPRRPRPGVSVSDSELRVYANQAADDLLRFYAARADELVPGGLLLVASFGAGEKYRCCDGLYDVLNDALLELRKAGRLDRDTYRRIVFPIYFRTHDELTAPLRDVNSPVAGRFRIERAESLDVSIPLNERRAATGDLAAYAAEYTEFLRAFSEPILRLAVADQPDIEGLIEDVFQSVTALLLAQPAEYEFHYIEVAALLTRV